MFEVSGGVIVESFCGGALVAGRESASLSCLLSPLIHANSSVLRYVHTNLNSATRHFE